MYFHVLPGRVPQHVCVAVSFIVDDNVVKTTEIRRGGTLDAYDYPPDPAKDGFYFLGWECEGSDELGIASHYFTEDCDVHAVSIPDEEAIGPNGLFFRFADAWANTNTTLMSTGVIFAPENVVDRRLTWTSSDPSIADIVVSNGSQWIKVKKKVGATVKRAAATAKGATTTTKGAATTAKGATATATAAATAAANRLTPPAHRATKPDGSLPPMRAAVQIRA